MNPAINNSIAHRIKNPMLEALLAGFSAAVIAIGAADKMDLPARLQVLVSRLDVAWWLFPQGISADGTHTFLNWTLPINAAFYISVIFALLLLRGSARSASDRVNFKGVDPWATSSDLNSAHSNITPVALLLDSGSLTGYLALLPIFQWAGALRDIQVRTVRYSGKKHSTFEISLRSGLIAKVYACDRRDVYEFMEALKQAGFGPKAEFSIPQPISYLPRLHLLLQERVEGTPAAEVFNYGDAGQRDEAAERCARWLARFHALAPRSGHISDTNRLIKRSESRGLLIAREGGSLAAKAQELLDGLKAARLALGEGSMCAGHGDYGAYNIILGLGRTVVFDWDCYNVSDPARDVARFLVSLERRGLHYRGSVRALDNAAEVFLRTYLASNGESQVLRHLAFYQAAFCLKSASSDLYKGPRPRPDWAEAMLDAGLRHLDQGNIC